MLSQASMGSEAIGNYNTHEPHSLSRQGSLYDLTLDEVQNQLGNLGKPLGSMNLDDLLRTAEAIDNQASAPAHSSSLNRELSKKTVEQVWREIQVEKTSRNNTLGEMTLGEFLAQAGVSVDPNPAQWVHQYQMVSQAQRNGPVSAFMPNQHVMQPTRGHLVDSVYSDSSMSPSSNALGRKRVAPGDGVEKTVERRHKRMIKNRESAARSRARRQAYTQELENKVERLEEENRRLKRLKEVEQVLPSAPPPEPKFQLRRTSSSPL